MLIFFILVFCPANTFLSGTSCPSCHDNSVSPAISLSESDCQCVPGYEILLFGLPICIRKINKFVVYSLEEVGGGVWGGWCNEMLDRCDSWCGFRCGKGPLTFGNPHAHA